MKACNVSADIRALNAMVVASVLHKIAKIFYNGPENVVVIVIVRVSGFFIFHKHLQVNCDWNYKKYQKYLISPVLET